MDHDSGEIFQNIFSQFENILKKFSFTLMIGNYFRPYKIQTNLIFIIILYIKNVCFCNFCVLLWHEHLRDSTSTDELFLSMIFNQLAIFL